MAETVRMLLQPAAGTVSPRRRAPAWFPPPHPRLMLVAASFVVTVAVSLHVIGSVGVSGDEPWYLLQSYSLLHFHTVDLTAVLRDHQIYARFLGNVPDDHTYDFTGNGARVLAYLPGYALLIAPLYALGGRPLIGAAQSVAVAVTALLLYDEAKRLYGSGRVALFAALAYLSALPVLLYAGQIFPTAFALCLSFAGYVLTVRSLPRDSGRRLVWAGIALGAIAFTLPWLQAKYALIAALLPLLGIAALLPRLRSRSLRRGPRDVWWAACAIAGLSLLSFVLLLAYDRHYFGTWYPQYRQGSAGAFTTPQFDRVTTLYGRMVFDAQSGLLPWAPLLVLAVPGFVVLLRRARRPSLAAVLCLLALLGSFLSVAIAPHVGQAYAYPARFVVESFPFLALFAAGMFAAGAGKWHATMPVVISRAGRIAIVAACLTLLCADGWISAVGQLDPSVIYPTSAGVRLAAEFPDLLPRGWFAFFPNREAPIIYRAIASFDVSDSRGQPVTLNGATGFVAQPGSVAVGATVARTALLALPSGRFVVTFEVACETAGPSASPFTVVALRERQPTRPPATALRAAATACAGMRHPTAIRLQCTSDGYRRVAFSVLYGGTARVAVLGISYAPASGA